MCQHSCTTLSCRACQENFQQLASRSQSSSWATQEMEPDLGSVMLKTKHRQSNGYQEGEMVQLQQKWTQKEQSWQQQCVECPKHPTYGRPGDQTMIISASCKSVQWENAWECFTKEFFTGMLLLIPPIKQPFCEFRWQISNYLDTFCSDLTPYNDFSNLKIQKIQNSRGRSLKIQLGIPTSRTEAPGLGFGSAFIFTFLLMCTSEGTR